MGNKNNLRQQRSMELAVLPALNFERVANDLCKKAVQEAKSQLHPLLQNTDLDRLDKRGEFLQAFKSALESRIARALTTWHPAVQAVFKYEETPMENMENWDGSIHLLVKVPRLSNAMRLLGTKLDQSLVDYFRQKAWERLGTRASILEVHQVTPHELRHGIGYAAMFWAVYSVPVQVFP